MSSYNSDASRGKRPTPAHLRKRSSGTADAVVTAFRGQRLPPGVILAFDSCLVRFKDAQDKDGIQEFDFSRWLHRRELTLTFAKYFATWGQTRRSSTRNLAMKKYVVFTRFLNECDDAVVAAVSNVGEITKYVMDQYISWLDSIKITITPGGIDDGYWHGNYKAMNYNFVVKFLESSIAQSDRIDAAEPDLRAKRNPWPERHHTIQNRQALSMVELANIRRFAIQEVCETLTRLRRGLFAVNDDSIVVPHKSERSHLAYSDRNVQLKTIMTRYAGNLPPRQILEQNDPGLARSLKSPFGSYGETASYLHFTARSLVPFVLLIAIDSAFNAEGLLTLRWADIEKHHPVFGDERWRIGVRKARGGGSHSRLGEYQTGPERFLRRSFARSVSDVSSPVNLLIALEELSGITRKHISTSFRDRVFVFWQSRGANYSSYNGEEGAACDPAWVLALASFIADHNLKKFNISGLRVTASDIIDQISGGDVKAKQAGLGHANAATTDKHYQSTVAKQRGREALAEAIAWRERYTISHGRSDTRSEVLALGSNTAATPGFGCVEPRFSPIPGQREGRLCSAYGACPACPLATVDVSSPATLVRLRQVRDGCNNARSTVHPQRWLETIHPQLQALEEIWLPKFSAKVNLSALTLHLPDISAIE